MSSIPEIFSTMAYGPAPEAVAPAEAWLEAHGRRFGLFIDGGWTEPGAETFETLNPATGKESVNATLPVGLVMARAIRDYRERTGHLIGLKPAGGIRTAKDALDWLVLVKEELGDRWLRPDLFRFGASSLLTDVERQLEHFVTGRYSAGYRHPVG